jgi:hypothetical protein
VTLTAILFADDLAVEKQLRRELAAYGITTADQMRVVAHAELVWVKRYLRKYPGLQEAILKRADPLTMHNPTLFGIFACHTVARIEREIGTMEPTMLEAMLVGYAIMWETAMNMDKVADEEAAQQRRKRGAVTTKAKADKRRALVRSLIDAAARDGRLDVEQVAAKAGCSPDTIYRYMREGRRKPGR